MAPKSKPREKRKGINDQDQNAFGQKKRETFAELFASPKKAKIDITKELHDIADKPHSFRYFHAPIKGHPDYERGVVGEDEVEPSQVIVSGGHVIGIEVDMEVAQQIEKEKQTTANLCQCCRDINHEVGKRLKQDLKVQQKFIARVLILECVLRIPAVLMLIAQRLLEPLNRFIYTQYLLSILFIVVFIVVIIWSVEYTDLGRQHPCNNILLVVKAILEAEVSCTATAISQRLVLLWRITVAGEEFDDGPVDWKTLKKVQSSIDLYYSYPLIIPIILFNITVVYLIEVIYFKCIKGNVKKDKMLWIAVASQTLITAIQMTLFSIYQSMKDENKFDKTLLFVGPYDWDLVQIMFSGVASLVWELWRLFDLRQVVQGKRIKVDEHEAKLVVLNFCTC